MRRPYPEFQFPLPRFQEQYNRLVELSAVAEKMHAFGVAVDLARTKQHEVEALARGAMFTELFCELTGLKREQLGLAGEGATNAVKAWFKEAGAPDVVFDKRSKKPQFNAAAMTSWSSDYVGLPFAAPAAALLGLRKAKTAARFAKAYYEVANKYDGRIHFDFNILGTKGERWSSSAKFRWRDAAGNLVKYSLNAQNVPAKTTKYDFGKYGMLVIAASQRDCFLPDPGCVWVKFDYEGAEAALIAYYTQDELMMRWLRAGADFHTENAKLMFNPERGIETALPKLEKGDPNFECRIAAKPATFGLAYQMPLQRKRQAEPHEVYRELWKQWKQMFPGLTESYFGICMNRYWAGHQGIKAWQLKICERVSKEGHITLPQSGKVLYVSDTAKGKNMSGNFLMQSGIGFLISRAMPPIAKRCTWDRGGLALLFPVHDELDLQIPEAQLDETCAFVSDEMSRPADFDGFTAGVQAAPDVGDTWGTCKPYRVLPD